MIRDPWSPAYGEPVPVFTDDDVRYPLTAEGARLLATRGPEALREAIEQESEAAKAAGTQRLRDYWNDTGTKHGKSAHIEYDTPPHSDFDECVARVGRFIADPQGYCALRHHEATGYWPGHAPGERWGKKNPPKR